MLITGSNIEWGGGNVYQHQLVLRGLERSIEFLNSQYCHV